MQMVLKSIYYQKEEQNLPSRRIGTHWCLVMGHDSSAWSRAFYSANRPFAGPGHMTYTAWTLWIPEMERAAKTK